MKKLLLLPFLLLVINAQAQDIWTEYATSQPMVSTGVRSISIVDDNITWLNMACGTTGCTPIRRFAKTVNGGSVWNTAEINLGPSTLNLEIANIHGVSASVAFASVFPKAAGVLGGIWKTTDSGVTWVRQNTASFNGPEGTSFTNLVYFWNANEGIAMGDPANGYFEIYKTVDGGTNWTRIASTPALIPLDPQEYGLHEFAVSGNSIWASTTFGRLLHSADKGATWSVIQTPIPDFGGGINGSEAGDITFSDTNNGLLQTSDFLLYKTNDGGVTWNDIPWEGILRNFDIAAIPGLPNAYVSVGEDLDLAERGSSYSIDGGFTWISINDNPDVNYVDGGVVAMLNENVGFASGFSISPTVGGIYRWNGGNLLASTNGNILLNAFIDSNNNNIKDANETYYFGGTFSYQVNAEMPHYVNAYNGQYYLLDINPLDSYNLGFSVLPGTNNCSTSYTLSVASYSNVTVAADAGTVVYSFPLVPTNTDCTDLSVYLVSGGSPRPSNVFSNTLFYKNSGNQTIASGVVTFNKDPNATMSSVSPTGAVVTATGFTYAFTNLLPNEQRILFIYMSLPAIPFVSMGQILTETASITPTDAFPENNTSAVSQTIVASYDPNDMAESHGGKILHSSFTNNDYLTYTIRFENTGTAEAFDIHVDDLLDAKLDETSMRMIAASHDYTLERVGSNLTWNFADINLPPSVANTMIGKGYIVFEIKPKPGYAVGDVIPNTANIYFDTNPPIVTNTFNTEFVATLAVNQFDDTDFTVYPNPTNGLINISSKKTTLVIESISLVDVLGNVIINQNINLSNTSTDISQLSKGLYFLEIKSNGIERTIKIIKE